ncbi:MAG: endospore germination permease [Tissierellia bacterium]|nr:endospore germination permease [Tissierellia bacterium]
MQNEKIPTRQLFGLLIVARLSFSISSILALHVPPHNQDQWVMVIVACLYIAISSMPILFLANRINKDTVKGFVTSIYGRPLSRLMGVLYLIYFIILTIDAIILQTELVTTSILPESSNYLITTLMLMVCIYMTSRGVIVILRSVDLLIPVIYSILFVLIVLGINNVDFSLFLPILSDSTINDINKGALILSTLYNDIIIIAMLVPELKNKNISTRVFFGSLITNMIILNIVIIITQGALGIEYARHSLFPFLIYVRLINLARIVERIAAVFVVMWLLTITFRINILLYLATKILRDIFNKGEDDKLCLFIVSTIVWIVSIGITVMRPVVGTRNDLNNYLAIIFVIYIIIIPLITCMIFLFRRKSISGAKNQK